MKLILLSLAICAFTASCNTMVGVGRDTRILGEAVEKTAEKATPGDATTYDTGAADTTGYEVNPSGDIPVY